MRRVFAAMVAVGLVMAGCGDDDAVPEPTDLVTTPGTTTVATSATSTSTTTSTTTTLAPTTTLL